MGTVRRVTRNVKRWSSSSMALRWTVAAMNEAKKGFRRLKAYKAVIELELVVGIACGFAGLHDQASLADLWHLRHGERRDSRSWR
jgi:hypothetical protein